MDELYFNMANSPWHVLGPHPLSYILIGLLLIPVNSRLIHISCMFTSGHSASCFIWFSLCKMHLFILLETQKTERKKYEQFIYRCLFCCLPWSSLSFPTLQLFFLRANPFANFSPWDTQLRFTYKSFNSPAVSLNPADYVGLAQPTKVVLFIGWVPIPTPQILHSTTPIPHETGFRCVYL